MRYWAAQARLESHGHTGHPTSLRLPAESIERDRPHEASSENTNSREAAALRRLSAMRAPPLPSIMVAGMEIGTSHSDPEQEISTRGEGGSG